MISGRQALGSIDQTVNQAHQQVADMESGITEATEQLLALRTAQAEDYRDLARVRVERLADPELVEQIDQAEQQVMVLLAERSEAIAGLQQEIAEVQRLRELHEAERRRQADRLDAAVGEVDEAEAKTQLRLDTEPDYRAQRERQGNSAGDLRLGRPAVNTTNI